MAGYCKCGCGNETPIAVRSRAGRYRKGEPTNYLPGHGRCLGPEYIEDRETGCWEWQRHKNPQGYGHLHVKGVPTRAHRHFYEKFRGAIPSGLDLDHLCLNKSCVNPWHLEPVTKAENARRRSTSKLSMEAANEIRKRIAAGEQQAALATEYGVSRPTITLVKQRKVWA